MQRTGNQTRKFCRELRRRWVKEKDDNVLRSVGNYIEKSHET